VSLNNLRFHQSKLEQGYYLYQDALSAPALTGRGKYLNDNFLTTATEHREDRQHGKSGGGREGDDLLTGSTIITPVHVIQ
jgi:hypothetical protein